MDRQARFCICIVLLFTTWKVKAADSELEIAGALARHRHICGVCALRQCLHIEGIDVSFGDLISRLEMSEKGVMVNELCKVARELGASAEAFEFDRKTFGALRLPAILIVSEQHAVCAAERDGDKIRIVDATGNIDEWTDAEVGP